MPSDRFRNELEHRYLYGMHYNVNVKLSTFTKHYFALKEYAEECRMADIRPLNKDAFIKLKVLFTKIDLKPYMADKTLIHIKIGQKTPSTVRFSRGAASQ